MEKNQNKKLLSSELKKDTQLEVIETNVHGNGMQSNRETDGLRNVTTAVTNDQRHFIPKSVEKIREVSDSLQSLEVDKIVKLHEDKEICKKNDSGDSIIQDHTSTKYSINEKFTLAVNMDNNIDNGKESLAS